MDFDEVESSLMEECLRLALRAEGMASPNPMVGAIVVDPDGNRVGAGYHQRAGEPHAEVNALREAGAKAKGGTIYVSLEPCCHFGKTPPCTDAIIEAGISKVVASLKDPNSKVAGNGFKKLEENGVEVRSGLLEIESAWLNRGFIKRITKGVPWVTLKMATTLDGRIADRFGKSKWITSPASRKKVHELRSKVDCVLIGANTARLDNPELNVREIEATRQPARAVLDPHLSLDKDSHILQCQKSKTSIYCLRQNAGSKQHYYGQTEIKPMDAVEGIINLEDILKDMAADGINHVLVEGGSNLAGQMAAAGLIDEIYWFLAPKLLPDSKALSATSSDHPLAMESAIVFDLVETTVLGEDTLIHLKRKADSS